MLPDVPVPGQKFTFGVSESQRKPCGDFQCWQIATAALGLVHLGRDLAAGLNALQLAIQQAALPEADGSGGISAL